MYVYMAPPIGDVSSKRILHISRMLNTALTNDSEAPWRTSPPNGPACHSESDPRAPLPFLQMKNDNRNKILVAHLPNKISHATTVQSLWGLISN